MKRIAPGLVLSVGVLGIFFESLAVAFPIYRAPLALHTWWPLPVACAGVHCVTYRQWTALMRQAEFAEDEETLLTELLTARAAALVARRTGLSVSEAEVDEALRPVRITTASEPAITRFLAARAINVQSPGFRTGLVDMLLRAKLAATGISDVWTHPAAPSVTVFHVRYRWDENARSIETR
ncbi:MAG: hypothetical protein G01um1014106_240 [Parcubacteria group bacterium Gr01-1014_106]|nr:MAG: hypothetical protein G01um1014106_240 [Parcubacteria group bacterium Gr01-1014_106]